jgi:hypothetical protein
VRWKDGKKINGFLYEKQQNIKHHGIDLLIMCANVKEVAPTRNVAAFRKESAVAVTVIAALTAATRSMMTTYS